MLSGGAGLDRFVYHNPQDGGDIITDFTSDYDLSRGQDQLLVSALGFGGGLLRNMDLLASGRFVDGTAATGLTGQFLFDLGSGRLWWDQDGAAPNVPALIATFTNGVELDPRDIRVIA